MVVLLVEVINVLSLSIHATDDTSEFRFANIYGNHMVLQAKPFSAIVWGFGEVGQSVAVRLGSENHTTEVIKGKVMYKFERENKKSQASASQGLGVKGTIICVFLNTGPPYKTTGRLLL